MRELRNWIPQHLEIGTWKHCLYCGELPESHDHVIPVKYFCPAKRKSSMKGTGLLTPSCGECNSLLGDSMFPTICERISFVNDKLSSRYRKVLAFQDWSEDELDEISQAMADNIRANLREKHRIQKRLLWIYSMELIDIKLAAVRKAKSLFPENKQLLAFIGCLD